MKYVGGDAAPYHPKAILLFAQMSSQPTDARKRLISATYRMLEYHALLSKLDLLYVLAAHDSQAARLNWITPGTNTLSVNSAPTFTTDSGYHGDGTDDYLDTGIAPNALTQFQQNSAHISAFIAVDGDGDAVVGRATAGGAPNLINGRNGGNAVGRVNVSTSLTATVGAGVGHTLCSRTSSSALELYRDGVSIASTGSSTSAARDSDNFLFLRSGTNYSTDRLSAVTIGAGLDDTEAANMYAALYPYLDAIGAF
jgi:hypothetical protein